MAKDKLTATVTIQGTHANVKLEGVWTKHLIDIAHKSMINALRGHLQTLRLVQNEKREVDEEITK